MCMVHYSKETWQTVSLWGNQGFYFWTVVSEKALESPLDCKEIKPVNLKGNQAWKFIGRTDAEAETTIIWPPDVENWLIGKYPDAGKDWRQEEKGTTEDEMVGWHHQLHGPEFEQVLRVGDRQGSLACCSPWGCKELHTTEGLNWTEVIKVNINNKNHWYVCKVTVQYSSKLSKSSKTRKIWESVTAGRGWRRHPNQI